ncbi:hypothetical protein BD410DRAFT_703138, partial [Rickenella mellea]
KTIPTPPGLMPKIIELLKEKIAAGVYESSDASYRSGWFAVPKKNGELRPVISLEGVNSVTIKNAGEPPVITVFVEKFGGKSIYSCLDIFVGFD